MAYIWHDADYDKRIQMTIDSSKVDEDQTDFPLTIHISNSSGITNLDVTSFFSELTTSGTRKKMALYTVVSGVDTQCYVEVDKFDIATPEAWLYAKIPTVVSDSDTDIYLYYDADHADNTTYIGDLGSTPAQQVWSDFSLVLHMSQDPSTGGYPILDSTSNNNDMLTGGGMTSNDVVSAQVDVGIDFDGGDYAQGDHSTTLNPGTGDFSVTVIGGWSGGTYGMMFGKFSNSPPYDGATIFTNQLAGAQNAGYLEFRVDSAKYVDTTTNGFNDDVIRQWDFIRKNNELVIYINGSPNVSGTVSSVNIADVNPFYVYGRSGLQYVNGVCDEVRMRNDIAYSAAYIKASYNSHWDSLLTFNAEEARPSLIYRGYVQVQGIPAARTVYLYRRSTGELMGSTTSDGSTGYFQVTTPYSDYHFINILPLEAETYNIIVRDKIIEGT